MTLLHVTWRIEPATPPRPLRPCKSCGHVRPFLPSGKVRLNANGRRLDAWLIYRCTICDATWNLPLLDRVAVASIPPATLEALHRSDPKVVRTHAFDLALLRRYTDTVQPPASCVHRTWTGEPSQDWTTARLTLLPEAPAERLDRLLARELALSRAAVLALLTSGNLVLD